MTTMGVIKFIRDYPSDHNKVMRVLDSCKTSEHISVLDRMIDALWSKWDKVAAKSETVSELILNDRKRFSLLLARKKIQINTN